MEYIRKLEENFQNRRKQNPIYSLRAYARDLGLHPSTLSKVLKGERGLPFCNLDMVALRLKLDFKEKEEFFSSVLSARGFGGAQKLSWPVLPVKILKNDLHFQILTEWEYFAFLNLMKVKGFRSELSWISERLNIPFTKTEKVIRVLLESQMIQINSSGQYIRCYPKLATTDGTQALALRISHQNEMKLALQKLWHTKMPERDFFSMTLPANPKKLRQAKILTRQYFRQMEALLEEGELTEVYQLAVQLYPVSQKASKSTRRSM